MNYPRILLFAALAVLLAGGALCCLWPSPAPAPAGATPPTDAAAMLDTASIQPHGGVAGRSAVALGPYGAAAGQTFDFTLRCDASTELTGGEQKVPTGMTLRAKGNARFQVIDRRVDTVVFAVSFPDLEASVTAGARGSAMTELAAALARPTLVRMRTDGTITGYRFAADSRAEQRNWVRTLVSSFRVGVPTDAASAWTRLEGDATGVATVVYEVLAAAPLTIAKTKSAYQPTTNAEPAVAGEGRAAFDAQLGWPVDSRYRETIDLALTKADFRVRTTLATEFAFVAASSQTVVVPGDLWDGTWAAVGGGGDVDVDEAASIEAIDRDALRGVTVPDLIATIVPLASADGGDRRALIAARDRLAALLAMDPAAVEALRHRLLDPSLDDASASVLLSALGAAATKEAQAVLQQFVQDGASARRVAALQATFQVSRLEPALLAGVRDVLVDPRAELDVAGTAMLLLGAVADPGRADADPARWSELLARESLAQERGLAAHWLDALGNSGRPEVVATVQRYLAHDDNATRTAAVTALRRIATEDATNLLASTAIDDATPRVRGAAVDILASRNGEFARAAFERAILTDPAERVRRAAILALGREVQTHPDAQRLLRRVAATDSSTTLRSLALEVLGRR